MYLSRCKGILKICICMLETFSGLFFFTLDRWFLLISLRRIIKINNFWNVHSEVPTFLLSVNINERVKAKMTERLSKSYFRFAVVKYKKWFNCTTVVIWCSDNRGVLCVTVHCVTVIHQYGFSVNFNYIIMPTKWKDAFLMFSVQKTPISHIFRILVLKDLM